MGGDIRLIARYGMLLEWVHAHDIANAVVCTGRPPTNVSDILPTIHLTYQRV